MKRWILFFFALLAALTATAAVLQYEQQLLSEKLIRLHVVANSDSAEDQAVKLAVRDAVVKATAHMDRQELECGLSQIQSAAERCLSELGRKDAVCVSFRQERFPTRVYEQFALPAGVYQTIRVTIGEGAGKNWWCVAFPSICFRATAKELQEAAVAAGFTEREVRLITGEEQGYILKFKIVEWLGELKAAIFD